MSVTKEILIWSKSCPAWQRDALRRLVDHGSLSPRDLAELALICESTHAAPTEGNKTPVVLPLTEEHLPLDVENDQSVTLTSIDDVQHVNALVCKRPLTFQAAGMTVLYGDNAAGKSGYARVLKAACRARSKPKQILPDVFQTTPPGIASATIKFKVGGNDSEHRWRDDEKASSPLTLVSVFDSACALHYVETANDVAFRPFGLDLLDKLAAACVQLKRRFDERRSTLLNSRTTFTDLEGSTEVAKLVASLTAETPKSLVDKLATLTEDDKTRLGALNAQVAQIEAEDPAIRAKELKNRANRLDALRQRLAGIESKMSDGVVSAMKQAQQAAVSTTEAAKLASESAFRNEPLSGVGSDTWKELWEAARRYSEQQAYRDTSFPFVSEGALCLLCQQPLSSGAAERFLRFDEFVRAETQKSATAANKYFAELRETFIEGTSDLSVPEDVVSELELINAEFASNIRSFLQTAEERRANIFLALTDPEVAVRPLSNSPANEIKTTVDNLNTKAIQFEHAKTPDGLAELKSERDQLLARQALIHRKADVIAEIDRLEKLKVIAACLRDVDTTSISRKSTELTKSSITQTICDRFALELDQLGLAHLRVDLVPVGSERGVMYHRVSLQASGDANVQDVASEGEYRCIALAGFLSELATANHKSALVFDDPVSSLDHAWRESVARRLAMEAKTRQVVVFTHDLVFLLLLLEQADLAAVTVTQSHIRRGPEGAGLCDDGPPWLAMDVKNRIGALKAQWQQAEKIHRTQGPILYEAVAKELYGRLRETWERAVEEILLNRVVLRFRRGIETQRLDKTTDITISNIEVVESAMSKCSTHLRGHDQALAINQPMPAPAELRADIEQLDTWTAQVRKRRV